VFGIRVICAFCSLSAEYSAPAVGWNHGVGNRHCVTAAPAAAQGAAEAETRTGFIAITGIAKRNHRNHPVPT